MRTCVCPYGRKAKYVLLLFKHAEEQVHAVGDVLTSALLVSFIEGPANVPCLAALHCWAVLAGLCSTLQSSMPTVCVMRPHALSIAIACLHTIQIGT